MQGLTRKEKLGCKSRSPIRFDELQITIFVRTVDFVADYWVSEVCEVYANLMGSACFRFGFYEGELVLVVLEPAQDPERSKGWISVGMDSLLQPNPGWKNGSLPQERLVHDISFFGGPAEDNGGVSFADAMLSNHEAQLPGCFGRFPDQNEAAGFAVEAVDQGDLGAVNDFESQQTPQFIPEGVRSSRPGWVNEEICGFVNDQKPVIFVDDGRADPAGW
jgi:hypothetical protein